MDCVIYTRVSLDRTGEALAVARQEQECRVLADRLGFNVAAVYSDNDISATTGKVRPGFESMLKAKPTAIIVWHQDRLLRLTSDLERVIALDVPVHTVSAGTMDLSTPAGRAVARTVAAWSQYEGEQKALRQVAANAQRAAKGSPPARIGYGYRRAGDSVVLDQQETATIREAVRRVLDGQSLRSVCLDFNTRDLHTPGRGAKWNTTTLKQLLLRPSLAGLSVHQGEVVGRTPEDSPRIIDEDTHERLKALLNDPVRRTSPAGRTPKYLLGGIARCGRQTGALDDAGEPVLCGGVVVRAVGRKTRQSNGNFKRQPPSYVCSECYRVRRKQSDVDAVVEGIVVGRLQMPDAAQLFATGDPAALEQARADVASVDARLANAADLFASGSIDGAQLARISERLRIERERATAAVAAALPASFPADLIGANARQVWDGLEMDVKRAVLDTLVAVTILPSGSGKPFDPDAVQVVWRS